MPVPDVPVRRTLGPAPIAAPLGLLQMQSGIIRLGVPELGSVEIEASGIRVVAPSDTLLDHTWSALGAWATAQWLMTRGLCVMRGSAVAKDGKALVLLGESRVGVSVTAAQLTRHGWRIVSDGLVVINSEGQVLSTGSSVRLDTMVAERLFADAPIRRVASIQDRMEVSLAGHDDAALAFYLGINLRASVQEISVARTILEPGELERPPAPLRWSPLLPVGEVIEPPEAPSFVATRPQPRSVDDGPRIGPPAMAHAILDAIGAL